MPTGHPGRRAPGLGFGHPRVVAVFGALSQFRTVFGSFYAKELRPLVEDAGLSASVAANRAARRVGKSPAVAAIATFGRMLRSPGWSSPGLGVPGAFMGTRKKG